MTEPIRWQVRLRVTSRAGDAAVKSLGADQIIRTWALTGATPEGVEVSSVRWHNYIRRVPEREASTPGDIERARNTLHLAELAQESSIAIRKVG